MNSQDRIPLERIRRGDESELKAQAAMRRIHEEIQSTHRETAMLLGSGLTVIRERSQSSEDETEREMYSILLTFELNHIQRLLINLQEVDVDQYEDFLKHLCDIDQRSSMLGVTPDKLDGDIISEGLRSDRWVTLLSSRIEYIRSTETETLASIEQVKNEFLADLPDMAKKLSIDIDIEAVSARINSCKIIVVDPLVTKIQDYGGFYDPEERVIGISYAHAADPEELQAVVVHELFHVISGHDEAVSQITEQGQSKDVVRTNRTGLAFARNRDIDLGDSTITLKELKRFAWFNEAITEIFTVWYMKRKDFFYRDKGIYKPERKMTSWVLREAGIADDKVYEAYFEAGDIADASRAAAMREVFSMLRNRFGDGAMVQADERINADGIDDHNEARYMELMAGLPNHYSEKLRYFLDIENDLVGSETGEGFASEIASALFLKNAPGVHLVGFSESTQSAIRHAEQLVDKMSPELIDAIDDLLDEVAKLKPVYKAGKAWKIDEVAFEDLALALEPLIALRPFFTASQKQRESQALRTNGVAKMLKESMKDTELQEALVYYLGGQRIMLEYATAHLPDDSDLKKLCAQIEYFAAQKSTGTDASQE